MWYADLLADHHQIARAKSACPSRKGSVNRIGEAFREGGQFASNCDIFGHAPRSPYADGTCGSDPFSNPTLILFGN